MRYIYVILLLLISFLPLRANLSRETDTRLNDLVLASEKIVNYAEVILDNRTEIWLDGRMIGYGAACVPSVRTTEVIGIHVGLGQHLDRLQFRTKR